MKLLNQISIVFVALFFLYTISYKSVVTLHFFINQSEIIELFCVNKEKPQLKCNGKCHLAKELVEVDNNEDNPFSENKLERDLSLTYIIAKNAIALTKIEKEHKKQFWTFSEALILRDKAVLSPPPKS